MTNLPVGSWDDARRAGIQPTIALLIVVSVLPDEGWVVVHPRVVIILGLRCEVPALPDRACCESLTSSVLLHDQEQK